MKQSMGPGRVGGFTLTELMIVVAIIGLLMAIALPGFVRARESTTGARYTADVRAAKGAFQVYAIDNRRYPADSTPGLMPVGMSTYLGRFNWYGRTSLGGRWDWDYRVFGVTAAVSVYQPTATAAQLAKLDALVDDGDTAGGSYRTRANGFMAIIE